MESSEIKAFVIELCQNVIKNLAQIHEVDENNLKIRIDLKDLISMPVFALFEKSRFIVKSSMNEIIDAGGGREFRMVVSTHVNDVITNIFSQSLKIFEISDTRQMFILLYVKDELPMIAIYKDGVYMDAIPVGDFIGTES